MTLILIVPLWFTALLVVAGLCSGARRGDHAQLEMLEQDAAAEILAHGSLVLAQEWAGEPVAGIGRERIDRAGLVGADLAA